MAYYLYRAKKPEYFGLVEADSPGDVEVEANRRIDDGESNQRGEWIMQIIKLTKEQYEYYLDNMDLL